MPGFADAYGINLPAIGQAVGQAQTLRAKQAARSALANYGPQVFDPDEEKSSNAIASIAAFDPSAANALSGTRKNLTDISGKNSDTARKNAEYVGRAFEYVNSLPDEQLAGGLAGLKKIANDSGIATPTMDSIIQSGDPRQMRLFVRESMELAKSPDVINAKAHMIEAKHGRFKTAGRGLYDIDPEDGGAPRMVGLTPASPGVSINMGQESAFGKKVGETQGERYSGFLKGADDAQRTRDMLGLLGQSLDRSPYRGPFADFATDATRLGNQLGLNLADTSQAETARSLSHQMALMLRNPAGGAGMPGALSDSDRNFLVQSVPSLNNSPGGGKALIHVMTKLADRKTQIAQFADRYVQQHGMLDSGFDREVADWSAKNPLFTEQEKAALRSASASSGLQQSGEIPTMRSPDEARRLPRGTKFRTPDGRILQVP
jgi:hypothetical protein